ncbi:hypothetical protein [Microbacterium maritypicum]|uniref:Uncharacterized protein n=1 Tax=Microbacterium maritypicum TaxID=33918 RepID=A0A4Y4B6B0_MICMQ|nr:hypothetical protein [Microbacterium liquefaciens]GEC74183.1 hypothetical protein MLI01_03280 [Microbacterium liquefaciens]GGV49515.1 hypothetical protein GCM10010213_03290 [Microbacterium liquefaciens]
MDSSIGNTAWFQQRFGDAGPAVAKALIRAGHEAHNRSSDTKAASGLTTDEAYGATFWQVLAIDLVEQLSSVQGIRALKPKGARHPLPIVNGTTIHAVKCASRSGSRHDQLKIRWSQFRDDSMSQVARVTGDVLPLAEWLDEDEDEGIDAPTSPDESVVLAAFVASASGGLERIYIGDGYIDRSDDVYWVHYEEIPVRLDAGELISTVSVVVAERFDSAPGTVDIDMGLVRQPEEEGAE